MLPRSTVNANGNGGIIKINKMYESLSFFDLYGSSIIMFFVLGIFVIFCFLYATVMQNFHEIKNDWSRQRCNPKVLPFAGLINKPDNQSTIDFTSENFNYCVQTAFSNIAGYLLQPMYYVVTVLNDNLIKMASDTNDSRKLVNHIRTNAANVLQNLDNRVVKDISGFNKAIEGVGAVTKTIRPSISTLENFIGSRPFEKNTMLHTLRL